MTSPPISVVIVNWNHGHLLPGCLDALLAQSEGVADLHVVDNGSGDGSAQSVSGRYPRVRVTCMKRNLGFSAALNWGIKHCAGDLVLSLNPDVIVAPGFLSGIAGAMAADGRIGIVAPKLLCAGDSRVLDSTGLFIDRRKRPFDRGQGEVDRGQYDQSLAVFGACGAAALYRRAMLEDVAVDGEVLDEHFFAYYEDADLSWRAQLRGWRSVFAPQAEASHDRGWGDRLRGVGRAAKSSSGPRLALRNRYLMTAKNDRVTDFLVDLPLILASELPRLAYAAVTKPRVLLGLVDLARALPVALKKRRTIQARRSADGSQVRSWFLTRRSHESPSHLL